MSEQMLTVKEVATRLQLHPRTISNMAQRGEIPAVKIGRRWRFLSSVIEQVYTERVVLYRKKGDRE